MKANFITELKFGIVFGLLLLSIHISLQPHVMIKDNSISTIAELDSLGASDYWNLTSTPIFINDADPLYNWSKTVNDNDWCHGSGTWVDPYVIENVTINGGTTSTCIEILNSNKYFTLKNCTLFNSRTGHDFAAISLENVNNSLILENNCSYNNGHGIRLINTVNNTILHNMAHNNTWEGISLRYSSNNTIRTNSVINNYRGIRISDCDGTNIVDNNTVLDHYGDETNSAGIGVYFSQNTIITRNKLANNIKGIYYAQTSNIILKSNDISGRSEYGVYMEFSNDNLQFIDNYVSYCDTGFSIHSLGNLIVSNNTISSCGTGMGFQGTNANIIGNQIINCSFLGISIGSNDNPTLTDNHLTNCEVYINSHSDKIPTYNISKSNLINGNPLYFYYNKIGLTSSNFSSPGQIILFNCNNSYLSSLNLLGGGITLLYSNDNTISDNTIQSQFYGLDLENCNNCTISNNTIFGTTYAMNLRTIMNCTISKNQIIDNSYAISLMQSNKNIFYNNNCSANLVGGYLFLSTENNLTNNVFSNNLLGIYIYSSYFNNVLFNRIINNSLDGIRMYEGSNNSIMGNRIHYNNVTGIAIPLNSNYNLIFNNTFIGNPLNAQDNGTTNNWDNGIIGNFWYDYNGIDSNHNNIGDSPYNISGLAGSKDNFPIFSPPGPALSILSPSDYSLFGSSPPIIDLIEESVDTDTLWYFLDNGTITTNSYTFTGSIDQNAWNLIGNGTVKIRLYINDTLGKVNFDEIYVRKDIIAPQIRINSPTSLIEFEENSPTFDLSILEGNLDSIWYSLDSGINNYQCETTGQINQALWDSLSEGDITIRFSANDTLGNVDFVEITVSKSIPETQLPSVIPGYNVTFLLGINSVIMIFIIKKLNKK